ncbi:DUF3813 family protein [Virgibacillus dakarensis]|nr:DUF3813 family protein [Virgibacillus dakarensis]
MQNAYANVSPDEQQQLHRLEQQFKTENYLS